MCDHCGCREFTPVQELTAEHDVILKLAWALAESTRLRQPIDVAGRDLLVELLAAHVIKEETGLYPMLFELGALSADALATLEQEHLDIDSSIIEGRFDRRAYFELAAHIEVEDTEVFSSGRFTFDEDDWDDLQAILDSVPTPALP